MTGPARRLVRNRLVVHIHGYQPTGPDRFHRRFARELGVFGATWSLATRTESPSIAPHQARWEAETGGPGWRTRTDYRIIRLDDLIEATLRRPLLAQLARGYLGLFDFVFGRALMRYFQFNWHYALFTLTPLAMTLVAALAGLLLGILLGETLGAPFGLLGGLALFAAGIVYAGRRHYLYVMLGDWAFASVLARRLEPEIERRLNEARRDLAAAMAGEAFDEIVLIGHSLGAVLVLHLAEKLLTEAPTAETGAVDTRSTERPRAGTAARTGPRLGILTIGSSVLKIGLHEAAAGLRGAARAVTASPAPVWADYQSAVDVMNFPGVDPAVAMGVPARYPPIVRKAPFSRMLDLEAYRRLRRDFFRTHNQFFHAGTRRCAYDYFMFACGPFYLGDLAYEMEGAMTWLDGDGALTPACPSGPLTAAERHRAELGREP